jgi:hypothetical protein
MTCGSVWSVRQQDFGILLFPARQTGVRFDLDRDRIVLGANNRDLDLRVQTANLYDFRV